MIVIISSGKYSDFKVQFIDIGQANPDKVVPLLLEVESRWAPGTLLGMAPSIEWREPSAMTPLSQYWENIGLHEGSEEWDDDCPAYTNRHEQLSSGVDGESENIWARPWDPQTEPCTCIVGRIYAAAQDM